MIQHDNTDKNDTDKNRSAPHQGIADLTARPMTATTVAGRREGGDTRCS
jgi:hypothetical protein